MIDLKPACDRAAVVLAGVTDDQLSGPTPCSEYDVGAVVDHLDGASRAFAAIAGEPDGEGADTDGDHEPSAANLRDGWRDGVAGHLRALGEAWDAPAAWQGSSSVAGLELPNAVWGRIALTEVVVHGWDIAKATGRPFALPEETLRACLDHVATFVPDAPLPELWGPAVEIPAEAPLLDRIVAVTGRTP